jgi:hypothetical protein
MADVSVKFEDLISCLSKSNYFPQSGLQRFLLYIKRDRKSQISQGSIEQALAKYLTSLLPEELRCKYFVYASKLFRYDETPVQEMD